MVRARFFLQEGTKGLELTNKPGSTRYWTSRELAGRMTATGLIRFYAEDADGIMCLNLASIFTKRVPGSHHGPSAEWTSRSGEQQTTGDEDLDQGEARGLPAGAHAIYLLDRGRGIGPDVAPGWRRERTHYSPDRPALSQKFLCFFRVLPMIRPNVPCRQRTSRMRAARDPGDRPVPRWHPGKPLLPLVRGNRFTAKAPPGAAKGATD